MTVIDTSAWIEMLRHDGRKEVRAQVVALLHDGQARLVAPVRLELWNGARGEAEKKGLRQLEAAVPELAVTSEVWEAANELARNARAQGLTCPATDILIKACANYHGAAVVAVDAHFSELAKLG
jgi:predicted nucleic acid-binding protein